jgi:hypothetical protein
VAATQLVGDLATGQSRQAQLDRLSLVCRQLRECDLESLSLHRHQGIGLRSLGGVNHTAHHLGGYPRRPHHQLRGNDVMNDGEQPRAEAASLLVAIDPLQGAHERLVRGVLGALRVPEPNVAVAIECVEVAGVECSKCLPIASGVSHEDGIRPAVSDDRCREMQASQECAHGLALTMNGSGDRTLSR